MTIHFLRFIGILQGSHFKHDIWFSCNKYVSLCLVLTAGNRLSEVTSVLISFQALWSFCAPSSSIIDPRKSQEYLPLRSSLVLLLPYLKMNFLNVVLTVARLRSGVQQFFGCTICTGKHSRRVWKVCRLFPLSPSCTVQLAYKWLAVCRPYSQAQNNVGQQRCLKSGT